MNQALPNIIFSLISFLFILLWAIFFFFYSPRKTTPKRIIFISFLLGMITASVAFLLEVALSSLLNSSVFFLKYAFAKESSFNLYANLLISVFLFAAVEEFVKFIFLRQYLKINEVNQVIDGMKVGVWLGLGFVFIENTFYFLSFYSQMTSFYLLAGVVFLRGIFSTLAHALYGAIIGYYLSLAKFNKFYRSYFLQKGFLINIIIHGFFNLFLVANLGFLSIVILIYILVVALMFYNAKNNLIKYSQPGGEKVILPGALLDRIEMETLLSEQNAPAQYFRQLLEIFPLKRNKKYYGK